jgi:hypothetical protein
VVVIFGASSVHIGGWAIGRRFFTSKVIIGGQKSSFTSKTIISIWVKFITVVNFIGSSCADRRSVVVESTGTDTTSIIIRFEGGTIFISSACTTSERVPSICVETVLALHTGGGTGVLDTFIKRIFREKFTQLRGVQEITIITGGTFFKIL